MKITSESSRQQRSFRSSGPWALLLVGFLLGFLTGRMTYESEGIANTHKFATSGVNVNKDNSLVGDHHYRSFATHLSNIPLQATSHKGVNKKVLLDSFGIAKNLAALSVASIDPGQEIESHNHPTMFEFFYVLSGEGHVSTIVQNGEQAVQTNKPETVLAREGTFLQNAPGDFHSFRVEASQTQPMRMIYFGITTD